LSAFLAEGQQDNGLVLKEPDSVLPLPPNTLLCTQEASGPKIGVMEFVVRDLLLIWMFSCRISQQQLHN
jgi:hypothetical protein